MAQFNILRCVFNGNRKEKLLHNAKDFEILNKYSNNDSFCGKAKLAIKKDLFQSSVIYE